MGCVWTQENLYWLTQQPYPVAVMSKGPLGPVTLNKGNEAECYLHFIVEHYHHLPRRMVFTHGHRSAWHLPVRASRDSHWHWLLARTQTLPARAARSHKVKWAGATPSRQS